LTGRRSAGSSPFETTRVCCTHLDVCFTWMVIFWRFRRRSILLGRNRHDLLGAVGLLLPASRADFGQVDEIDFAVFSIADVGGRSRTVTVTKRPWRGLWSAGGVLRQPPKPAQVSRSYRGLPGLFREYLRGYWLFWLCQCHPLLYVCDVITCTCILRAAPFGAELGEILVGSSRGIAICGVVRACTLQGRTHCAGGGARRQNVAREAHRRFKSLLASRLRPLSSKVTHPPNYRSLHSVLMSGIRP